MTWRKRIGDAWHALTTTDDAAPADARATLGVHGIDSIPLFQTAGEVDVGGEVVGESDALTIGTVWSCASLIARTLAKLELRAYRRVDGRRERLAGHRAELLLNDRPNPEQDAFTFREQQMLHRLLWGNAFAEIVRNAAGRAVQLWPIHPSRVRIERRGLQLVYIVEPDYTDSDVHREPVVLSSRDVLHLRGMSLDGITGLSVVRWAAVTMGLTRTSEKMAARIFSNTAAPPGYLKSPESLSDSARSNMERSWLANYGGENWGTVPLLEEGTEFVQTMMPLDDMQLLATRQHQVPEVCRWFHMPPHKVADLSRATFSNIESQQTDFAEDCIAPEAARYSRQATHQLDFAAGVFVGFDLDAVRLVDFKSRMEGYRHAREIGVLNADEIREREDQPPIEGGLGTAYMVPANMVQLGAEPTEPDEPEPAGDEPTEPDEPTPPAAEPAMRVMLDDVVRRVNKRTARACDGKDAEQSALWRGTQAAWVHEQLVPVMNAGQLLGMRIDAAQLAADWVDDPTTLTSEVTA